ncbi:MAG: hypothetical protein P8N76_15465 [Pirellulaceae bacterium]|nr:hypothetical protein [Pirellulaceae bacterium]
MSLAECESVSRWLDKSGNEYHASREADLLQPTYQTDVTNGLLAIRLDGQGNDGMIIDDGFLLERSYTAFIVSQYDEKIKGRTPQSRETNGLHGL